MKSHDYLLLMIFFALQATIMERNRIGSRLENNCTSLLARKATVKIPELALMGVLIGGDCQLCGGTQHRTRL